MSPFPALSRRLPRTLAGLVLVIGTAVGLSAGPAQAATVRYVALGDSYSSGLGAGSYTLASGICYRNALTYPVLWKHANDVTSFRFRACAGATTDTVTADQLDALSRTTTLVTITVGGNDVGFAGVVATCTLTLHPEICDHVVDAAEQVGTTSLPGKLTTLYATIREKAPNARLVVLGYPQLFEAGPTCGTFGMIQANRVRLNAGAVRLNAAIAERAEAAGAQFVDVSPYFEGHRICAADPWINGLAANLVESYHPNRSGYSDGYLPALQSVTG